MNSTDLKVSPEAMLALSYGLYIISSCKDGQINGQISNAVMQVTDSPARVSTAMNKKSMTFEFIRSSGVFSISVLAESMPKELISLFGFRSGRDMEKFSQISHELSSTGCPVISEHSLVHIDVQVDETVDCDTHVIFVGKVVSAQITGQGRPMTYSYYREVIGGKTPPTAPTYMESIPQTPLEQTKEKSEMDKYVCNVCGYVYDPSEGDPPTPFDALADDWVCPECGVGKDEFSPA